MPAVILTCMDERVGRFRMTVGLLGPALIASILAVIAAVAASQIDGAISTVVAAGLAVFFAAVAVRDVRRWRHEMTRSA
jgi:hypothetical protein